MLKIGVIGAGDCSKEVYENAEKIGAMIAEGGNILICGGLGGVMEAAAKGAKSAGGSTVGILPGVRAEDANSFIDIPIVTGLGHARNFVIVHSSDALFAFRGEYGTLSEISIAQKLKKPVISICSWETIKDISHTQSPEEAINKMDELMKKNE